MRMQRGSVDGDLPSPSARSFLASLEAMGSRSRRRIGGDEMSDRVECAFCGVLVEKDEDGLWQHSIPSETYHYCRFGPTSTRSSVATPVVTNAT
jgi:hypothetical protein